MPLNCPIKTSKEWQDIFARANGDEDLAYQMWEAEGYANNEDLNELEEQEVLATESLGEEDPNELTDIMKGIKQYLLKQLNDLRKRKIKNQKAVLAKYRSALVMSSMVTFIAAYHYMRIFDSFKESSVDMTINTSGAQGSFNEAYRYVDWLLILYLIE